MAFANPTITDFKTYFFRDFPYGTDITTSITDQDIANAYLQTNVNFNEALWADQENYNLGYFYLSAHYLVLSIRASSQGISGQWAWNQTGKSVGSVNETLQIPERIMANPEFAWLTKTTYGTNYLMLIMPQLVGQMFIAPGSTRP